MFCHSLLHVLLQSVAKETLHNYVHGALPCACVKKTTTTCKVLMMVCNSVVLGKISTPSHTIDCIDYVTGIGNVLRDWKRNSSSGALRVASQYIFNGQLLGSRPLANF